MKLDAAVVLLTGASGGIGQAIAEQLLQRGARVLMTGRDLRKLANLRDQLAADAERIEIVAADLTQEADRRNLVARAATWQGGVDVLINNAGVSELRRIENYSSEQLAALIAINLTAPLQLCRALLPHLRRQPAAHILNIGSVYGAIGYPGFTVYSASKFGLRGFTEGLRRELADTRVRVQYLAPRATRTSMNSPATDALNEQLKVTVDSPHRVAQAVCQMLERGRRERTIGWPEKLFVRVNAILPQLVDSAVRNQLPTIHRYADAQRPNTLAHVPDDSTEIARTSI